MPPTRAQHRSWPAALAWLDAFAPVARTWLEGRVAVARARLDAWAPAARSRLDGRARPATQAWLDQLARSFRAPSGPADDLDEARELLAYWEQRARRLPRWALMRRREAREMASRWRDRVRDAERDRYGRGFLGAASQLAIEHRLPAPAAHRGRQALQLARYAALATAVTFALLAVAAVAVVAEAVLSAL